jgi:hypothetical protein
VSVFEEQQEAGEIKQYHFIKCHRAGEHGIRMLESIHLEQHREDYTIPL